jgi:hypothetical protein
MGTTSWIHKMIICYGANSGVGPRVGISSYQDYIALHADLLDAHYTEDPSYDYPTWYASIKSKAIADGRTIKLIAYFDIIAIAETDYYWSAYFNSDEDNFMHITGGDTPANRIERTTYPGQFLSNPDSADSGWYETFWTIINRWYTDYTSLDGIFIDDCVGEYLSDYTFVQNSRSTWGDGFNYSTTGYDTWVSWMEACLAHAKTHMNLIDADNILMANCFTDTNLGKVTKCSFWEHFQHTRTASYNTGYASIPLTSIDLLYDVLADAVGNKIAVNSGVSSGDTTQVKECCKYVYACAAFAAYDSTDNIYFAWNFMGTSSTSPPTWFSWWDNLSEISTTGAGASTLGDPEVTTKSTRLVELYTGVYERVFDNYYVIANTNAYGTSKSVTFMGTTYTMAGKSAIFIPRTAAENIPPIANFYWSGHGVTPKAPLVNEDVGFSGSLSTDSDGTINLYEWDWDNGHTAYLSSTASPDYYHISWPTAGVKSVTLRVTDNDTATDTITKTVNIGNANVAPTADFDWSPIDIYVNQTIVTFDASDSTDDSSIIKYEWDFNNDSVYEETSSPANNPTITHLWATAGVYTVGLKVTDDGTPGLTNTITHSVTVTTTQASYDWYDSKWPYRKEITINGGCVWSDETNFPVLYKISGIGNKSLPNGTDIIFVSSNGINRYHHDLISFSDYTGSVWIQIPELTSGTDKRFFMYYGNTIDGDQTTIEGYKPSSTWDDTFVLVCHMQNSQSNTKQLIDSTKWQTTLWKSGSIDNPLMVSSFLGSAQKFQHPLSKATMISSNSTDGVGLISGQFSVSIIVSGTGPLTQTYAHAFDLHRKTVTTEDLFALYINSKDIVGNPNKTNAALSTQTYSILDTVQSYWPSTNIAHTSVFAFSYLSGGSIYTPGLGLGNTYLEGHQFIQSASDTMIGDICDTPLGVIIGNRPNFERPWSGCILDVQVSNRCRDEGWFITNNFNISSLSADKGAIFYTIGQEETPSAVTRFFTGANRNLGFINTKGRYLSIFKG